MKSTIQNGLHRHTWKTLSKYHSFFISDIRAKHHEFRSKRELIVFWLFYAWKIKNEVRSLVCLVYIVCRRCNEMSFKFLTFCLRMKQSVIDMILETLWTQLIPSWNRKNWRRLCSRVIRNSYYPHTHVKVVDSVNEMKNWRCTQTKYFIV